MRLPLGADGTTLVSVPMPGTLSPTIELADFLVTQPSLEQVVAFRLSPEAQARVSELVAKEKDGQISADERDELNRCTELGEVVTLLKARARLHLTEARGQ